MRGLFVAVAALAFSVVSPASASAPQIVDPANDANGGAYWHNQDAATPVGSQPYADVTSVRFASTRSRAGKVTGFAVDLRLAAPPAPPGMSGAVYRVHAFAPGCLLTLEHDTSAGTSVTCGDLRVRAAGGPRGESVTWTVPLASLPRTAKVSAGTTLTDLHFEVFLRPHAGACAGTPAAESEPCVLLLDDTLDRDGTFRLR